MCLWWRVVSVLLFSSMFKYMLYRRTPRQNNMVQDWDWDGDRFSVQLLRYLIHSRTITKRKNFTVCWSGIVVKERERKMHTKGKRNPNRKWCGTHTHTQKGSHNTTIEKKIWSAMCYSKIIIFNTCIEILNIIFFFGSTKPPTKMRDKWRLQKNNRAPLVCARRSHKSNDFWSEMLGFFYMDYVESWN